MDADQPPSPAEDLFAEYALRLSEGKPDDFDEVCRAHPELAGELRRLHERHMARKGLRRAQGLGTLPSPGASTDSPSAAIVEHLRARGASLSRYRVLGEIGAGGMGTVYEAEDLLLERTVALKVIADALRTGDLLPLFHREMRIAARIGHPGVAGIHDAGIDEHGRAFFTMPMVRGKDLSDVFQLVERSEDGWNLPRALGVLRQVCETMSYVHSRGVIHRDLKPTNVRVGSFGEVFVMDWGIAKELVSEELSSSATPAIPTGPGTLAGGKKGTAAYMSPEQAGGNDAVVGPKSDVYSVGAMLYELLAGDQPCAQADGPPTSDETLESERNNRWVPMERARRGIPAELVQICVKAMEHDPADRYADMAALAADLSAYLEQRVVSAYETGAWAEIKKWVARHRALAATTAAALIVIVGGSAIFATRLKSKNVALDGAREDAEQKANDVLSLSAIQDLDDLIARADKLWPAHPENITKYEDWLRDARELIDGRQGDDANGIKSKPSLAEHKAKLAELEQRALPQAEQEHAAERASHPRTGELAKTRAKAEWMSRMLGKASWPSESEVQVAMDQLSPAPADVNTWNEIAWPLVDPDKEVFGDEVKALVCAQRAIDGSDDGNRYAVRDTLAWALFKLSRFDEALAQERKALEEAPQNERATYAALVKKLEAAIQTWRSPAGDIRPAREMEWSKLATEVEGLERVVSARRDWTFEKVEDRWWHVQLSKLIANLEAFADPTSGLLSSGASKDHGWGIEKRLEFAPTIEEQSIKGPGPAKRWEEAIASIQDAKQCPKYGGVLLTPQLGLLPIGRDIDSGLWEFAHLQSGAAAERGPDGGLVLTGESGLVLVLIPGGGFWMGAQYNDPTERNFDPQALDDEPPVHEVALAPYFLSKYEMTQGQWERITGGNPSFFGPRHYNTEWNREGKPSSALHPVENVSWTACSSMMGWLSLFLPTEAQWEYGARAGTTTVFWSGDEGQTLHDVGNVADAHASIHGGEGWNVLHAKWDDGNTAHSEVGSYRANAFGLHDVHGNNAEWCRDGYGGYTWPPRVGDGERFVPGADTRILRGGSFFRDASPARCAARGKDTPENRHADAGVRPARSITN